MDFLLSPWFLLPLLAVILITGFINLIKHGEEDDGVDMPTHVSMSDVDAHTAQEVFDWVAYVAKVTNSPAHIRQMVWNPWSTHHALLISLKRAAEPDGTTELLDRIRYVGVWHGLAVDILDAPY